MPTNISPITRCVVKSNKQFVEISLLTAHLRQGIWILGIPSWLFGISDRSFAAFADGYLSVTEVIQLFTASFFFLGWLYLKPEETFNSTDIGITESRLSYTDSDCYEAALLVAQARMIELQEQHMISQEYTLPFPYLCQIYHLLNLKHLEDVHSFSLNHLKILKVTQFEPTHIGGIIKFQTVLDSPFNVLRIWRLPIVEVLLVLHTPYTVELSIPVYNDKHITVIFNTLPLSDTEHELFIDIYSNLEWPRPLLQTILHFASYLTLFEDLPYLRKLAERANLNRVSKHETMLLFSRFVELYGSRVEKIISADDEQPENLPATS